MGGRGRVAVITSTFLNTLDATHQLWDPRSGRLQPLPDLQHVTWQALDPAGRLIVWGSEDGVIHVRRISDGATYLLVGHDGPVTRIAVSPDGRWIASAGDDNTLRLWPMPDLSQVALDALPRPELLAKLKSLTNIRVVRAPGTPEGWKVDLAPFPGWKDVPTW